MDKEKLKNYYHRYGASIFIASSLLLIGVSVSQVQSEQSIATRAAGDNQNQASEIGLTVDPSFIKIYPNQPSVFRIKLETLTQSLKYARIVLEYDPSQINILGVDTSTVFGEFEQIDDPGRLTLTSNGDFFGSSTWATIQFAFVGEGPKANIKINPDLSSLRYEDQSIREVAPLEIQVEPNL